MKRVPKANLEVEIGLGKRREDEAIQQRYGRHGGMATVYYLFFFQ